MLKRMAGFVVIVALGAMLAGCASDVEPQGPSNDRADGEQAAESEPSAGRVVPSEPKPESKPLREGKGEVTVLVLNASGEEGAAREAADGIEALGFEHVTVGNAARLQKGNRVSYHHEEHRAEVDEVAALFGSLPPYDPYCYEDASSGGWSMDYDILVMLGDPGAVRPEPV